MEKLMLIVVLFIGYAAAGPLANVTLTKTVSLYGTTATIPTLINGTSISKVNATSSNITSNQMNSTTLKGPFTVSTLKPQNVLQHSKVRFPRSNAPAQVTGTTIKFESTSLGTGTTAESGTTWVGTGRTIESKTTTMLETDTTTESKTTAMGTGRTTQWRTTAFPETGATTESKTTAMGTGRTTQWRTTAVPKTDTTTAMGTGRTTTPKSVVLGTGITATWNSNVITVMPWILKKDMDDNINGTIQRCPTDM